MPPTEPAGLMALSIIFALLGKANGEVTVSGTQRGELQCFLMKEAIRKSSHMRRKCEVLQGRGHALFSGGRSSEGAGEERILSEM